MTGLVQLAPPSVDMNEKMRGGLKPSMGTMTVPFGWTTGWPPMATNLLGMVLGVPQVRPPSLEVLM